MTHKFPFDPPPFEPGWLLRNPHLMTLSLLWPRRAGRIRDSSARWVEVGPGSRVQMFGVFQPRSDAPAVVVAHGLTGSVASSYVVGFARKAYRAGFHVIRVNARGSGGTENAAVPMNHYGLTSDLATVVRRLPAEGARGPVFLVGFSMGANQVLKLAGEWADAPPVDLRGVVAVSPAIDVAAIAAAIDHERRLRIYRDNFIRTLRRMVRRHHDHFGNVTAVEQFAKIRTFREFDELYTAPAWGFADPDDYYERASALRVIDRIAVPALLLAARDDVLVPYHTLESITALRRDPFRFVTTDHGGHCAFVAARNARDVDRFWAENRAVEWCESLLSRSRRSRAEGA